MRSFLFGSVALAALIAGGYANAADMPVKAPPPFWNWAGLYIGAHSGAAWGSTHFSDPFGPSIFGDRVRTPGYLFGAQIGFNWQNGQWVYGVEADISGLDSDGTNTCFAFSPGFVSANCHVRPQVTGTVTGRLGVALGSSGRTLVYGKGGLAWIHDDISITINNGGALASTSTSLTRLGGTAGAGIEHAITPAWSVKLEYDFLAFGSDSVASPYGVATNVKQQLHEVKLGLNYKWGMDPWGHWPSGSTVMPVKAHPYPAGWL